MAITLQQLRGVPLPESLGEKELGMLANQVQERRLIAHPEVARMTLGSIAARLCKAEERAEGLTHSS